MSGWLSRGVPLPPRPAWCLVYSAAHPSAPCPLPQATWLDVQEAAAAKLAPAVEAVQEAYPSARLAVWDVVGAVTNLVLSNPPIDGFTDNTTPCLGSGGLRRRLLSSAATTAAAVAAAVEDLEQESPADGLITSSHCSTPDTYTYWDSAHPTAAAHLYLARSFAEFLGNSSLLEVDSQVGAGQGWGKGAQRCASPGVVA